jgi:hypothetical protein
MSDDLARHLTQHAAWLRALADDITVMTRIERREVLHSAGGLLEHRCQAALRKSGFDPWWLDRYAAEIGWTSPAKRAERFREAAGYLDEVADALG